MYIDLFFLLLLSLFLGFRLWSMLGKNAPPSKSRRKSNLFVVPRTQVTIEKETQNDADFYPGFNESAFLSGAEKAFERIQQALKTTDKETLAKLVAPEFLPTLLKRLTHEDKHDAVCLLSTTIQEKKIQKEEASIAVQITSQQTHEGKVWTVEETWVFKRLLADTNPNWLLCKIH